MGPSDGGLVSVDISIVRYEVRGDSFVPYRSRQRSPYAIDELSGPQRCTRRVVVIEEDITRFQTVRGQCTEIRKSRESIEETLDSIESDIQNRLAAIEAELTKASEG
jgi:hypothetical protein